MVDDRRKNKNSRVVKNEDEMEDKYNLLWYWVGNKLLNHSLGVICKESVLITGKMTNLREY